MLNVERVPLDRRRQDADQRSAAARTATITTCGSIRTIRKHLVHRQRRRRRGVDDRRHELVGRRISRRAQYYHVVTTKHVPYHVCGAQQDGSTVCLPSDAGVGGGRGGGRRRRRAAPLRRRRRRARLHRAGSEGSRRVLRRRQQRHVHDAAEPPHRRAARGESVSAHVLRRAGERAQGTLAVDVPDRLLAGRSERAVHLVAARLADDQRRPELGPDQRRPHAPRSEDAWATPAARSPAT